MMDFDILELKPMLPELFLAIGVMAMMIIGVFNKMPVATHISYVAMALCAVVLYMVSLLHPEQMEVCAGSWASNGFIRFALVMLVSGTLLTLFLSHKWLERTHPDLFEFPILMLFSLLGMFVMVSANSFLVLYLGVEMAALGQYVLASVQRDTLRSTEAGLKYFMLGAIASGIILFGISLIYGFTGSIQYNALAEIVSKMDLSQGYNSLSLGIMLGLMLVVSGICFKVSAVPFHMWTPDVYEGSPTPVTAFFAAVPKVAGLIVFVRLLMEPFASWAPEWRQVVICVSVASMLVGALGALRQTNIKRLLAYSSIGHVGYVLIGLAAATPAGMQAILIYLALYVLMSIGAFGCVLRMRRNDEYLEDISDLAGVSKRHPHFALLLSAFMFSMAGIPPLAGFFGKMYIFLAAVKSGLFILAVIGVLASVIACYYYLKIVKIMYFDELKEPLDSESVPMLHGVTALCGVMIIFFFLFPGALINVTDAAVLVLVK